MPHALNLALEVSLKNLILCFDGKTYQQRSGLAMGVAVSPDAANLYCHFYERDIVPDLRKCAFYKRYIDDVFSIVYADSLDEAVNYMKSNVILGDLEIEWNGSAINMPFLDMFVHIEPGTNEVHHAPYRKNLNHFERIPWDSAHPLDVKRGTFIGELSRLATLSSKMEYYWSAVKDLATIYTARGYPALVINSWTKQYATKKWETRLSSTIVATDPVLVVKTEFNTAWEWFNIKELRSSIMQRLGRFRDDFEFNRDGHTTRLMHQDWLDTVIVGSKADVTRRAEQIGLPERALVWSTSNVMAQSDVPTQADVAVLDLGNFVMGNARWLLSRKRTANFADLAATWRSALLNSAQEQDFICPE